MSLAFLVGGIIAFAALAAIAERWSILAAGIVVLLVANMLGIG